MSIIRRFSFLIAVPALLIATAPQSRAVVIDFESLTGPSTFGAAGDAQTLTIPTSIGNVIISGGVVLTAATNLPVDETSIYGTAGNASNIGVTTGAGFTNPITITFPTAIDNFFLDIVNGNTESVTYGLADNTGNSANAVIAPNTNSGLETLGFPATGTVVTVDAETGQSTPDGTTWDFFIDNIHFDEPLPGTVPEPASIALLSAGLLGLGALRGRLARRGR